MTDMEPKEPGETGLFPVHGKGLDFFLGRVGSQEMVELVAPSIPEGPDGTVGLPLSWLGELARDSEPDTVIWLRGTNGSNDSFSFEETKKNNVSLVDGAIEIDHEGRTVFIEGSSRHITKRQFDLLWLLAENKGKVISRDRMSREIWDGYGSLNLPDVFISYLRNGVLGDKYRWVIQTRHGIGYLLDDRAEPGKTV